MKIKCGRDEYDINSNDIILDNGSCIQILTRKTYNGDVLRMSKSLFKKLLREGHLKLIKKEDTFYIKNLKYYKIIED